MTNEQILQNAEQHVIELFLHGDSRYYEKNGFVAGAHSRDEEISHLEFDNYIQEKKIEVYEEALGQLRHPWISVEERLPEIDPTQHTTKKNLSVAVLCWDANIPCDSLGQQYSPSVCKYDYERKDWLHVELGYYENEVDIGSQITHWMPIPQVPKGE